MDVFLKHVPVMKLGMNSIYGKWQRRSAAQAAVHCRTEELRFGIPKYTLRKKRRHRKGFAISTGNHKLGNNEMTDVLLTG
jgi:hypothetical protein